MYAALEKIQKTVVVTRVQDWTPHSAGTRLN